MAIPSPEKEARGRKAAESLEKQFKPTKFEPAFSEKEKKEMLDDLRKLDTKRSILNLRKKTLEYKAGKKKKKQGVVNEEDMFTKVIV